ncbi:MAG: hypothetical protein NT150_00865 [Bacteroidetes bacterium]|nr:hypothetical protein [Bacteroidota bacterium]
MELIFERKRGWDWKRALNILWVGFLVMRFYDDPLSMTIILTLVLLMILWDAFRKKKPPLKITEEEVVSEAFDNFPVKVIKDVRIKYGTFNVYILFLVEEEHLKNLSLWTKITEWWILWRFNTPYVLNAEGFDGEGKEVLEKIRLHLNLETHNKISS